MRGDRIDDMIGEVEMKEEIKAAEQWRLADRRPMPPGR
jgi:hypothetical protein